MDVMNLGIDLNQVAELTTQVATTGALKAAEVLTDQVFEFTIGIVVLTDAVWRG